MTTTCTARLHNSEWAYRRYGCRCAEAMEVESAKARQRASYRSPAQRPRCGGWDYDWVKVERAVAGDLTLRLTYPELAEAIDRLDRRRWSAEEIAQKLGVTHRTVQRRRAARRQAEQENAAALASRRTLIPTPKERVTSPGHCSADHRQEAAA